MTGGGSGGHITPLLSLAHAFKAAQPTGTKLVYIGLKGDRLDGLKTDYQVFDDVYYVPSGKFRRYHGESLLAHLIDFRTLFLNARDFFRVLHGIFVARKLLKKLRPSVVFCKGGFVSVPVGIAAHWQHVPIVTHDSDSVPGLANQIIGRWAVLHATGMPAQYYNYPKDTIRYTGVPVDARFKAVGDSEQAGFKTELGLAAENLVLLVGGAGLGARDVNNLIIAIAPELLGKFPQLHVLHVTGKDLLNSVRDEYASRLSGAESKRVTTVGFTPDFYKFSGAADLVISRAGATTITELAIQKKPVILIPAPFLTGGHQLRNAEVLENNQAAKMVPNDTTPQRLLAAVVGLLDSPLKREALSKNLALSAKPEAAKELAEVVLGVAERGTGG